MITKEKYRIVEQYFKKVQYSIKQDYSRKEAIEIANTFNKERAFAPEHLFRIKKENNLVWFTS